MITDLGYFLVGRGFTLPNKLVHKYLKWSYLRDTLKNLGINCVLDVGANQGQFAKSLRKLGYREYILSFEPVKEDFSLLSKAFERDRFWRGFNIALGNENSVKPFNITTESTAMSSFLAPKEKDWEIQVTKVEIKKLDTMFDALIETVPSPRVFLKMDTQGYDLEVVKGAESCINRILGLLSELSVQPTYENMPSYLEALKMYEQMGFKLIHLSEADRNPKTSEIIEYDCIMARLN
jgi:FkbM family methyltransferase